MKPVLTPQRLKDESYEDYKARRKKVNAYIKWWDKGRVLHNSSQGIYRKPTHTTKRGDINEPRK